MKLSFPSYRTSLWRGFITCKKKARGCNCIKKVRLGSCSGQGWFWNHCRGVQGSSSFDDFQAWCCAATASVAPRGTADSLSFPALHHNVASRWISGVEITESVTAQQTILRCINLQNYWNILVFWVEPATHSSIILKLTMGILQQ